MHHVTHQWSRNWTLENNCRKAIGKALQNQINKGETAWSILALTNIISWFSLQSLPVNSKMLFKHITNANRHATFKTTKGNMILQQKEGGWSVNAEYEPKYCVNKNSGYFRIQIFFMFHVNLHVPHRNHIFTITSGTSRAMQPQTYSNAIGRHQRHTIAGMTCVQFRITVRTPMSIMIQHLQRIWRRSCTHQHTPMRFHIVIIHHASCHTSMKPQLNSWKQNCRKAKEMHSKIKSTKAKRHEAFLLPLLLLLTLLWQTWFHDFGYNHCR